MILYGRYIWRRKGLWLRAILCWTIGMAFVAADREHEYDLRQQIRGPQAYSQDIVLINLVSEELKKSNLENIEELGSFSETIFKSDSAYWNANTWSDLILIILKEQPAAIGISPFIGSNIPTPEVNATEYSVFSNPKVIWSSQKDSDGKILFSKFTKPGARNSGLNDLTSDRDGVIRRFGDSQERYPLFAVQLARKLLPHKNVNWRDYGRLSRVINFRGAANTFNMISMADVLNRKFQKDLFKNKIVVIGTQNRDGIAFRTPIGEMSRMEITANIIDNIQYDRWIKRLDIGLIALLLVFFVLVVAVVTSKYPQFLAFFTILILNIFYVTLSLWIFDAYNYWLPIMAPIVASSVTYLIFLSFQLTLKEYMNVQLENEHKFLFEVEQLKNNFLSLISHDLKTPIAKIQGICDRLIAQYPQQEFTSDLNLLRDVASELYRYIRTILQITRVESRDFRISKDATDINEIIEAVVTQLEPLAKNKKIQLKMKLEPMFLIEVDHILIHEVILNLIENAIKYTPDSGTVTVSSQEVDERVIIMVEDTGPGIPDSEKQRIFEKFYRGELGKSQPKGSGLGLYLVKYFVELHNGKVFLDSSPKHGTKVGFSLPISDLTEEKSFDPFAIKDEPVAPMGAEKGHDANIT